MPVNTRNARNAMKTMNARKTMNTRRCGFCKCTGHTIDNCQSSEIEVLDNKIMTITTISNIFPFIKDLCIRKELETLTMQELKALSYKFEGNPSNKKYLKYKEGLIKLLTKYYYEISRRETPENYDLLEPFSTNIYMEFQFDIRSPNRVPDTTILRKCADIVYENMRGQCQDLEYYFKMTSWISRQIENYYKDYVAYMESLESEESEESQESEESEESQEFIPHRFDIFTCVQEQLDEPFQPFQCSICQEDIVCKNKCVELCCKHKFCTDCISQQIEAASNVQEFKHPSCALCRKPITQLYFNNYRIGISIHNKYIIENRVLMNLVDL